MRKLFVALLLFTLLAGGVDAQTKKKRVANKKFWIAAAVIVAASALDVESTVHWTRACPTCKEMNSWLYGKRPTRRRMYLTLMPITAATIGAMWYVKRDDDKQGTKAWLVIPIVHTAAHGGAAWYNYSRNYPPVCPAQGAGCAR